MAMPSIPVETFATHTPTKHEFSPERKEFGSKLSKGKLIDETNTQIS